MNDKDFYTIPEAAEIVKMCPITIRTMCKKNQIEGMTKIGSTFAIPSSWIDMYKLPDGFVSAAEASLKAGVSRWALQKAVNAGKVDFIRRPYSGGKTYVYVNVENAKWRSWVDEAQERSARYKK